MYWHSIINLLKIVVLHLTLAGDNAVVIAMAVRALPSRQQQKYHLKPSTDVPIVQIGGMPEIAAALSRGAIAAAPMSYPMASVAQEHGAKLLANMAKKGIAFVHVGITTSRSFLRQHRREAKAFLRAYGRAVHYMHIAKHPKVSDPGRLNGTVQYAYDFVEKIPWSVKRRSR